MPNSIRRLVLAIAVLLAVAPALARAQQCSITGPTTFCGPTAQLCGPGGDAQLVWSGPGIVDGSGACITVDTPGTYSLQVMDPVSGAWSDPCGFTISRVDAPLASITGATTGCIGSTVHLCGPAGNLGYQWSGPAGFAASTPCIDAGTAGDYTLIVTDLAAGCASAPVTRTLGFHDCSTGPTDVNCPRTARWWSGACAGSFAGIDVGALANIAACVDDHANSLDWGGDAGAMGRVMRVHPGDLRTRAVRQFAAVIANTCAGASGISSAAGPVGLDRATALALPGTSGTVGDWIIATDARLALLALHRHHARGVREAYRDIIRTGWEINHGHGIGAVCAADSGVMLAGREHSAMGDEPLADELSDAGEMSLTRVEVAENPARGVARLSLAVSDPSTEVVVGVYDLTGRLVRELAHGAYPAGTFALTWDGRDAGGTPVPNGMYFVQTRIGGERSQTRLTLLR